MALNTWKPALARFFEDRARSVARLPSMEDLCFVSAKDPRIWLHGDTYEDMIGSVMRECGLTSASKILEVGCAAGFLAKGLAPRVSEYVGVDLAVAPLRVARRLGLKNARFDRSDGSRLPFRNNSFDAAVCYDVFSNFPDFSIGIPIIREMVRVVRPGGIAMIGSVTDSTRQEEFAQCVTEVSKILERKYGPMPDRSTSQSRSWGAHLLSWFDIKHVKPEIISYYFNPQDFLDVAGQIGATARVAQVHAKNPYYGYRFNAVYEKDGA